MDRFSSPFRGESDEPWFRVGTIDVTSSVLVAAICTVSMLVYAFDKSLLLWMSLISDGSRFMDASTAGVRQGQVWRLISWPTVNPPDLWTLLSIAIIWYFGREFERQLGRRRYLWFLAIVVVLPACVYVLAVPTLVAPTMLAISGAEFLASAVILAFVVTFPTARSFFNIPFWVIAVAFETLTLLQLLGDRLWDALLFYVVLGATAMIAARSFGLSELDWIPKVPLPAFLSGGARQRRSPTTKRRRRRSKRGTSTVTPIRPVTSAPTPTERLRQAEVDVLLDKISQYGIKSLTPEERRRLDEHSRRMRDER
jgi:membrane associated rhomboid family serine protease